MLTIFPRNDRKVSHLKISSIFNINLELETSATLSQSVITSSVGARPPIIPLGLPIERTDLVSYSLVKVILRQFTYPHEACKCQDFSLNILSSYISCCTLFFIQDLH